MEMNTSKKATGANETSAVKKPYRRPFIQLFGRLHLLTQGSGPNNGDAGQTMMTPSMSDRITKENIVQIGTHPLGIGLYLFDYKAQYRKTCGYGRQFGVIAQEVETVMPEAVSVHPDGYKMVNYAMLGISQSTH
jgi:hypothetical protein